ncbi:histidine kinase dimerization/phospho-acceptor domain-containing protein [Photorhabdus luminescens]|uniref:histidine kinase dimerization/phospho-acceptor domain-containing protein n=1 Tax=Photorhabdus luminescens TaxID=29488 RepID=UPI001F004989|nr:histidine kinase dimerization/phospho-acceptor domain-containing protein [Photorhabdus luminescens]
MGNIDIVFVAGRIKTIDYHVKAIEKRFFHCLFMGICHWIYLELLKTGEISNEQLQLAETAHQCTLYLLFIINKLLDFSRIEAGQVELQYAASQSLPLLDQSIATIQGMARNKRLTLETFVAADVP